MAYLAALLIVAGVALYVAAPLFGPLGARAKARDPELERLMHERSLAVQALRELEFDHQMNKLSEDDYRALRAPLEARALGAIASIERFRAERRAGAAQEAAPPMPALEPVARRVRRVSFCPQCGVRIRHDANFCVECGTALTQLRSLALQAE